MNKKRTILKLLALCVLIGTPKAFAMTDDEANRIITQSCVNYKERVNERIVAKIVSMNGVQRSGFEIGDCGDFTYHGGQKAMALTLPTEFRTEAFDDGVRPTVLAFTAGYNSGYRQNEKIVFKFYWKKEPVYNNLGNLVGYDYTFYEQTYNDSSYAKTRFFYWIRNNGTGESAGTVDINEN